MLTSERRVFEADTTASAEVLRLAGCLGCQKDSQEPSMAGAE